MDYYAHVNLGNYGQSTWHNLEDHLNNTSTLANEFAASWNACDWGAAAGLLHDVGKYSQEFQNRLCRIGGEDAHIEVFNKVDHSTAGAKYAHINLDGPGMILANVIAGHHSGLLDGKSASSCLDKRLSKQIPDWSSCPRNILDGMPALKLPFSLVNDRAEIQLSVFIRMLYSCLVDADFLDTELFMDSTKAAYRHGYKTLGQLEQLFYSHHERLRQSSVASPVNLLRNEVFKNCVDTADDKPGFFSLSVPTGGGKTLSSMAFALRHARKYSLERIIYVIPFTSIIEQNAAVFRKIFGEDAVLEHHSNFEPDNEDYRSRLASENWDAPIIVTTNVQFFESLYSHKSSRCRKLHNIAKSVVILDEVQNLPAPFLLPCIEILKELVNSYNTSIVLCSATQPAIKKRDDFLGGIEGAREIIDNPKSLANSLERTRLTILNSISNNELAVRISDHSQVLCIVNTRRHARELFDCLNGTDGLIHLSALMCPIHRSQRISEIRRRLMENEACRVISTQLIEAGVDIDFPIVFRALAGVDAIAQAAGRCNREGKLEFGQVFVFTPESGLPPGHFRQTAQATQSVIRQYGDGIMGIEAIEEYFKLYYWTKGDGLDEEDILTDLRAGLVKMLFPFRTISEKFRFIKKDTKPVIIPFDDKARSLIAMLDHVDYPLSIGRRLQPYTVNIYPREWNGLYTQGSLKVMAGLFPVLENDILYSQEIGLICGDNESRDPETLYV